MVGKLVKIKSHKNRLAIIKSQHIHKTYYMIFQVVFCDDNTQGLFMLNEMEVLCE